MDGSPPEGFVIEILLVEDHAIVREGVRILLERQPDFRIVGEASSVVEAVALEIEPDLIIADLILGDRQGADVVKDLSQRYPGSRIIVLSMIDQPSEVRATLSAGAKGYVLKDAAARDLVDAVRKVAKGEDYLQPSLGVAMSQPDAVSEKKLTERETEILRLIALGHTNVEIAELLRLAVRTVEVHRAHLLEKLGLRTRAELVRYAVDSGIVDFSI
jgi:two-component system, NarL family, response regulator NreC